MPRDHNRVSMTGRLARDPELRKSQSGKSMLKFTLAVDNSYKDKAGQVVNGVFWNPCSAWSATADLIAKYCRKGSRILVEGKLETREYTGKTGERRWETTVNVENVVFLGSKSDSAQTAAQPQANGGYAGSSGSSGSSLRDESGFEDDFPLDFSEIGGGDGDVQIPF